MSSTMSMTGTCSDCCNDYPHSDSCCGMTDDDCGQMCSRDPCGGDFLAPEEENPLDAYDSIQEAVVHMQEAMRLIDEACAADPCGPSPCVSDRPRVFPCVLPPTLPCPGVSYPPGCSSYPSRAFSSLIPSMVPCPTCELGPAHLPRPYPGDPTCPLGPRLYRATRRGRTKEVRRLIRNGVNINYMGRGRWTPLHKACEMVFADVVWLLLKHGANPNARNCNGFTPLHLASFHDMCGLCVSLLICAGADLNCRNEPGQTPLHVASEMGNEAAVRALVAAGAKRFVKNNEGRTPFDVAEERTIRRLLVCRSLHPVSLY